MINFPILKSLEIQNYGLYPGTESDPGLKIDFRKQGLALIVGANGLGKTTLINIIFRLLSGPFDLAKFDRTDELGNLKLSATERSDLKNIFSARVQDQAKLSIATLVIKFGEVELTISRSLQDLSILDIKEGLTVVPLPDRSGAREKNFQDIICNSAKIADFGDWLLILHYIIFYQEDRRALVWDTSAQRELLRILLLDKEESISWKEKARKVLELDSEFRNLRSALNKEIKRLRSEISTVEDRQGMRSKVEALKIAREGALLNLKALKTEIQESESSRSKTREQFLLVNNELDGKSRDLESAKLTALQSSLPNLSDTAKFILSQLMAEDFCLACNSQVPDTRELLEKRLADKLCLVCSTPSSSTQASSPPEAMANLRIKKLSDNISELRFSKTELKAALEQLDNQLFSLYSESVEAQNIVHDLSIEISPVEIDLARSGEPATKATLEIKNLEALLNDRASELAMEHEAFRVFLDSVEGKFLAKTNEIQFDFNRIVQDFLVEDCEVSWKNVDWRLGQEGKAIEFPAFIFKMRSGTHQVVTERTSPNEVSESQREFIDLAFRIALINTASNFGIGSIIMDAPESSLDAIFVQRAANVFTNFSRKPENKLLLASNLVDGDLLPTLMAELYRTQTTSSALVNLFEIGTPSKAVTDYKQEYEGHLNRILSKAKEIASND